MIRLTSDMPPMPTPVGWFIILTGLVWLVYEVWTLATERPTISEGMFYLSKRPIIPFTIGLLFGHWFW